MSKKAVTQLVFDALSVLGVTKDLQSAVTVQDIYSVLDPADQCRLRDGQDTISKELCRLRTVGLLANGESKYVKNRSCLTWYLFATNESIAVEDGEMLLDEGSDSKQPLASSNLIEMEDIAGYSDQIDGSFIADVAIDSSDPMVKVNFDYDHEVYGSIPVQLYFSAAIPALPKQGIKNKSVKLSVLEHFRQFVDIVNSDYASVLSDVITDLKALPDAE